MTVKPEYIYRLGSRAKDLALTRESDYLTGLSFQDEPVGRHFLTLSVENLEKNGFIVRPDAESVSTTYGQAKHGLNQIPVKAGISVRGMFQSGMQTNYIGINGMKQTKNSKVSQKFQKN